jgi:hypothetical protein
MEGKEPASIEKDIPMAGLAPSYSVVQNIGISFKS